MLLGTQNLQCVCLCRLSQVYFVAGSVDNPYDLMRANAEDAALAVVIPPCCSMGSTDGDGSSSTVDATKLDIQVSAGGKFTLQLQ